MTDPNKDEVNTTGDELDALLDDAFEIVDKEAKRHELEDLVREKQLAQDLQRTRIGTGDGSGAVPEALDENVLKLLQSVLGFAGAEDDDSADTMAAFKQNIDHLVHSIESTEELGPEEKAKLGQVRSLLSALDTDDEAKAEAMLKELRGQEPGLELGLGTPDADHSDVDVDAAMRRCVGSLQQLIAVAATPTPTPTALPLSSLDGAPPEVVEKLLETVLHPEFVEPIRAMRDAYAPYLAAWSDRLSAAELARYRAQHALTVRICDHLQTPIARDEHERINVLLELMYEFSQLGEAPTQWMDYSPAKKETTS